MKFTIIKRYLDSELKRVLNVGDELELTDTSASDYQHCPDISGFSFGSRLSTKPDNLDVPGHSWTTLHIITNVLACKHQNL